MSVRPDDGLVTARISLPADAFSSLGVETHEGVGTLSFDVNVWQAQALAKAFAETARNLVPAEVGPALILPDWMNGEQRNGGPLS